MTPETLLEFFENDFFIISALSNNVKQKKSKNLSLSSHIILIRADI